MNAIENEYIRLDKDIVLDDVSLYIKTHIKTIPFTKIYIGTDSQNKGDWSVYVTAIVLHFNSNNGGHVIYKRDKVKRIRDKYVRLWGEVERSVNVANFLKNDCGIDVAYIDLDLNANVKEESNKVLSPAIGYVTANGYESRCKPGPTYAAKIADVLCR